MKAATRKLVRLRAGNRCEYCRRHQDDDPLFTFHIEHIIAKQHQGSDDPSNLALSCHNCNSAKGPNIAGLVQGKIVPLVHPRRQKWKRHFRWEGAKIVAKTKTAQATIAVLDLNATHHLILRKALLKAGSFPP
jgi:HNH endonuclease